MNEELIERLINMGVDNGVMVVILYVAFRAISKGATSAYREFLGKIDKLTQEIGCLAASNEHMAESGNKKR